MSSGSCGKLLTTVNNAQLIRQKIIAFLRLYQETCFHAYEIDVSHDRSTLNYLMSVPYNGIIVAVFRMNY